MPLLSRDYEFAVEEVAECPVCHSSQRRMLFVGYDDRFGQPDEFPVVECLKCGLGYLSVRVAESDAGRLYSKYYCKSYLPPPRATGIARWKHALKLSPLYRTYRNISAPIDLYKEISSKSIQKPRVLDIGSGAGAAIYAANYVVNVLKGSWTGMDIDEQVCMRIGEAGHEALCCSLKDFADKQAHNTHQGCFTHIIASQVIEHTYDPLSFLRAVSALLSPEGHLIISCPNYSSFFKVKFMRTWINWHIPYHLYQFNKSNLEILLSRSNLCLLHFKTVTPVTWESMQFRFKIPLRGQYNHYMASKGGLLRQVISDLRFCTENQSGKGDAIILIAKRVS